MGVPGEQARTTCSRGCWVKQVLIARPNQSDEQKEGGDVPANGSWEMRPLIRQR